MRFPILCLSLVLAGAACAWAIPPTRAEAVSIGRSFLEYQWTATERNVLHGLDADGIDVQTPDFASTQLRGNWSIGANTGVPYKWGGFDDLRSFDAGIREGKAAGDLYSSEKRQKGGDAVSRAAVGIDCSGFISRCWKLERKHSTGTLVSLCRQLDTPADLLAGDIMNAPGGHVILFVEWMDPGKSRAKFLEAEPFSKVIESERAIADLLASGFKPMRYRKIRE